MNISRLAFEIDLLVEKFDKNLQKNDSNQSLKERERDKLLSRMAV